MFYFKGKEFPPFTKQEVLQKVFEPVAKTLKQKHPDLVAKSPDEKEAILTGLIVKVVDSLGEDTRLAAEIAGLSDKKLRGVAGIFSNGLILTLAERNNIDIEKTKDIAFEVMHTRLRMMAGRFNIYKVIKEPYRPSKVLDDKTLFNLFLSAYKEF